MIAELPFSVPSRLVLPPSLPKHLSLDRAVGIVTTVPIEVLYAAGLVPVDLNNLFISHPNPLELAETAERCGFPGTCCCWTKGLYGAVKRFGIRRVVGVVRGDCSNSEALLEVLRHEGIQTFVFSFPLRQEAPKVSEAIQELAVQVGADLAEAERWRERLAGPRALAAEVDRLTWQAAKVHALENHLWLVSASDFCGDHELYARKAQELLQAAQGRQPIPHAVRLGFCGIPPIVPEIYGFLESLGALVVFNETQRQFAMTEPAGSLAEQYARYTYPYGIFARLEDIRKECERRQVDGLIHYVQSFCHRRIEDRIVRQRLSLPVLTLEADRPEPLSAQIKTRLESFVEMLLDRKRDRQPPGPISAP